MSDIEKAVITEKERTTDSSFTEEKTNRIDPGRPDHEEWRDGWDEKREKRTLRKMDIHLLPFVSLLYLLSFLDRSNIGNARVAGMATDLGLVGYQYNICAAVFFILYSAAEIPSNVALKLLRPSIWIPSIMVAWGVVMTLMCLVNSFEGLLISRIFLGLTEAGLFPGVTYYISLWYKRSEQSKRVAIFFSAATVAGAFGGLLAFGIDKMDGIGGLHGWQWIFCLEGILTVLVALVAFFTMHDYPSTAKFLHPEERTFVVERLKHDSSDLATHYEFKFVVQALADWKCWMLVIVYLGVLIPVYAFSLFLPTIINDLGYSAAKSQLMSTPPYIAGCICTVAIGIYSDKRKVRGPFVLACTSVGMIGYGILYGIDLRTVKNGNVISYIGTIIAACGVFPSIPVVLAWAGGNAGGDIKRGVALAMTIGFGNLGGICSSFIYRTVDSPRFHIGHGTVIGSMAMSFIVSCFAMYTYKRKNAQKDQLVAAENIDMSRKAEFRDWADDSPLFRYTI